MSSSFSLINLSKYININILINIFQDSIHADMDDIISYKLHDYLNDRDFLNGLSLCSRDNYLLKLRKEKIAIHSNENLDELIRTSFPSCIQLIRVMEHECQLVNDFYHEKEHYLFIFKLINRILMNLSVRFSFHHYDFDDFNPKRLKILCSLRRCVNSFDIICDLIQNRCKKQTILKKKEIIYINLNNVYRVPNNYTILLRNNFPYASALIY